MRFQESNLSGRLLGDSTAPGPTCSRFRASWERRFCLCRAELEHGRTLRALGTAPGRALGETQHGAGERQRFAEDAWKVQPEGLHEQRWERFPRTPKKLKRGRTAELRAAHQWPHVHETGAAAGARWVRGTCAAPAHLLSSSGEQSHGINPQVAHTARGGEGGGCARVFTQIQPQAARHRGRTRVCDDAAAKGTSRSSQHRENKPSAKGEPFPSFHSWSHTPKQGMARTSSLTCPCSPRLPAGALPALPLLAPLPAGWGRPGSAWGCPRGRWGCPRGRGHPSGCSPGWSPQGGGLSRAPSAVGSAVPPTLAVTSSPDRKSVV